MHRTVAAACIVALLCVITPSRVGGVVLAPTTHTGTTVTDHLPAREDPFPPPSFKPTAALPPLLVFNNGSAVTTLEEWQQTRREQVQRLIATVFAGTVPPTTPKVLSATVVNRTHHGQALSTFYLIKYDTPPPAPPASMYIELLTPTSGWGDGPWPLVLTQWNHRLWALRGVTRGYAAVVYPAADTRDATPQFAAAYPDATWALIMRRAWLASRVLDFVLTLADVVIPTQVGITGHSRNGKQSVLAAAFDERFTAVAGSSPGVPISSPWHFSSRQYFGETVISNASAGWWLNSTRAYFGRENYLAMDGHGVLASIAPRHCLTATAHNDYASDISFANERSVRAASKVYELYGQDMVPHLRIQYRRGDHHGFVDVSNYFDWFDYAFNHGGGGGGAAAFPDERLFPFDWEQWNRTASWSRTPPPATSPLRDRVRWLLGDPIAIGFSAGSTYAEESYEYIYPSYMLHHDDYNSSAKVGVTRMPSSFGDYFVCNAYYPTDWTPGVDPPLPAVVWLHPYSYNTGFDTGGYGMSGRIDIYHTLAAKGFLVLAYDQVGFGIRLPDMPTFYTRYPNSSRMARAVADVSAAVDFLYCRSAAGRANATCHTGQHFTPTYINLLPDIPLVDMSRVYAVGYSFGGNVALHAAALESRLTGVVSIAGFTPMRSDPCGGETGGICRLFDWHALIPRLGIFQGRESSIPYDYDDLLRAIAPRPTMLYTPLRDRGANWTDVAACVQSAAPAWAGHEDVLNHVSNNATNALDPQAQSEVVAWLVSQAKPKPPATFGRGVSQT